MPLQSIVAWGISQVTYYVGRWASSVAKRLECVQLAAALACRRINESGSKLHALQTLRALNMALTPYVGVLMAVCS